MSNTSKPTPPKPAKITTPAAPKAVTPPAPAAVGNPGDFPAATPVTSDGAVAAITDAERNQMLNNDGTAPASKEAKAEKKAKGGKTYTHTGKGLFVIGSTEFLPGVPTEITADNASDEDFMTRLNYAVKTGVLTTGE